ncbi:MAG TPA: hypothetical protein VGG69_07665 [Rhizomicrobium sp.]
MRIASLVGVLAALVAVAPAVHAGGVVKGFPNEYESYKYLSYSDCPNGYCILVFDDVPAGAVLMATNINCGFYTQDNPAQPFGSVTLFEGASAQQSDFKNVFTTALQDANSYTINEQIRTYFARRPKAYLSTRSALPLGGRCKLSGTLLR